MSAGTLREPPHHSNSPASRPAKRGGSSSTSVHPLPTNEHAQWCTTLDESPLAVQSRHQRRLHRRFAVERKRTIEALADDGGSDLAKKARKLADCCQTPFVAVRSDGQPALVLGCCRDRLCPRCQRQRGYKMASRVLELVRRMNARRFCTLTLKSTDAPLAEQLDRMIAAFRHLRRLAVWRRYVAGGVWAIEVTYNPQTGQWHPHLHIIMDGHFFPHAELKQAWLDATGDSSVVDLRAVSDARDAARYIATYVGKLADLREIPADRIAEYARALHRRRLSGTFGTSHAQSLEHKDDAEPNPLADRVISVRALEAAAIDGDAKAAEAIAVFCQISRTWCELFNERYVAPMPEKDPSQVRGAVEAVQYCRQLAAHSEEPDDGEEAKQPPRETQTRLPY